MAFAADTLALPYSVADLVDTGFVSSLVPSRRHIPRVFFFFFLKESTEKKTRQQNKPMGALAPFTSFCCPTTSNCRTTRHLSIICTAMTSETQIRFGAALNFNVLTSDLILLDRVCILYG